jgi:site-specific DNA-methyltransferase (adenine-specific)
MDDLGYYDSGSAARFFYCAKASKRDRDDGCEGMDKIRTAAMTATADGSMLTVSGNERATARANHHPTVKPTDLMRYLCRLVTPPGGVVLDPFTGSGSTGKGAILEGFRFIGIEREAEYINIARARIQHAVDSLPNTLFDNNGE